MYEALCIWCRKEDGRLGFTVEEADICSEPVLYQALMIMPKNKSVRQTINMIKVE